MSRSSRDNQRKARRLVREQAMPYQQALERVRNRPARQRTYRGPRTGAIQHWASPTAASTFCELPCTNLSRISPRKDESIAILTCPQCKLGLEQHAAERQANGSFLTLPGRPLTDEQKRALIAHNTYGHAYFAITQRVG